MFSSPLLPHNHQILSQGKAEKNRRKDEPFQGLCKCSRDWAISQERELSVLYKSCWKSTCTQEHVHYDSIKLFSDMLKDMDTVRLIMISLPFFPPSYISAALWPGLSSKNISLENTFLPLIVLLVNIHSKWRCNLKSFRLLCHHQWWLF